MSDSPKDVRVAMSAMIREVPTGVSPEHDRAECARMLTAIRTRGRAPQRRMTGRLLVAAAALVAMVAVAVVFWSGDQGAPRYTLTGGTYGEGYVRATGQDAVIDYLDGTRITLHAGSTARLEDKVGDVRIVLESGRAGLSVTPNVGRWTVAAGPFVVVVTGTKFDVDWRPETQTFTVGVTEGSVRVRGSMAGEGVALRAGQRLSANVSEERIEVAALEVAALDDGALGNGSSSRLAVAAGGAAGIDDRPAPDEEPVAAPPRPSGVPSAGVWPPPTSRASSPIPTGEPSPPAESWSALVSKGAFDEVISAANKRGLATVLANGSAADLLALSDAARYTGARGMARDCLVAIRDRFPTTTAGKNAAFMIGRMAERDAAGSAIAWYDKYLADAPTGQFAAQALGRKMVLLRQAGRLEEARVVARRYENAFPKGSHASVARDLLR